MHNHNHVTSICLWCLRFLCRKKCSQVGAWSCSRDCPVAQMRCRTVDDSSRKHCSTRKIVWNPLPLSARIFDVLDCPVQLPSKCPLYISVLGGSWGKPTHCPFSEVESDSSRLQWLQLFHDSLKDRIRSASSATVSTSLSSMQSTPICCKTCHCCTAPKFPDFPTLTLLPIDIYWLSKFAAGFFLTDTAWDSTKCPMRHFAITSSVAKMFRGIWWSKSDLENEFQLAHPFCNLLWLVWLACVTSNLYFFLQLQIHRIHSWSPRRNRDRVDNLLARNPSKTSNSTSWTLVLQREETLKSLNRLEFDMTDLIILMIFDDIWSLTVSDISVISLFHSCRPGLDHLGVRHSGHTLRSTTQHNAALVPAKLNKLNMLNAFSLQKSRQVVVPSYPVLYKVYKMYLAICNQYVSRWAGAVTQFSTSQTLKPCSDGCLLECLASCFCQIVFTHVYCANQFVLSLGLGCCDSSCTSKMIASNCFILHGNMENKTVKKF